MGSRLRCFILSSALLCGTTAWAYPSLSLPEVSSGSLPYRAFGGSLVPSVPTDLLSVPAGQEFIITAVLGSVSGGGGWTGGTGIELMADGVRILGGRLIGEEPYSAFGQNAAHLKIDSGQTLSVLYGGTDSEASYFVQGYFVEEGSPYRSFFGSLTGSEMHPGEATIFTAEGGRAFIVRTVAVYCAGMGPDVRVDSTVALPRRVYATSISSSKKLFATGKGSLVVPPGSSLGLYGADTSSCDYYIDGEYTEP